MFIIKLPNGIFLHQFRKLVNCCGQLFMPDPNKKKGSNLNNTILLI